ncbi:hypothetical protein WJX82_002991 [Trebouxia sp. C0006]
MPPDAKISSTEQISTTRHSHKCWLGYMDNAEQEAGQDTHYKPCTVLGTAKEASWHEASSFAWLGKPFAEASVDSNCLFALQELVDEVKQAHAPGDDPASKKNSKGKGLGKEGAGGKVLAVLTAQPAGLRRQSIRK